ncbi:MAG: IS5 family transposase, partial [Gemmatales bacterium]|nr:IS5 family transposase [Gemmatales bacterium]
AANENTPLGIVITPGQQHDATVVAAVLDAVPDACAIEAAVMDKAYDSNEIRARLKEQKIKPVIPSNGNRKKPIRHDKRLYGQRNCVERLVGKLKQFRAVATRYDKLACTFLAIVHVVAAFVMAR